MFSFCQFLKLTRAPSRNLWLSTDECGEETEYYSNMKSHGYVPPYYFGNVSKWARIFHSRTKRISLLYTRQWLARGKYDDSLSPRTSFERAWHWRSKRSAVAPLNSNSVFELTQFITIAVDHYEERRWVVVRWIAYWLQEAGFATDFHLMEYTAWVKISLLDLNCFKCKRNGWVLREEASYKLDRIPSYGIESIESRTSVGEVSHWKMPLSCSMRLVVTFLHTQYPSETVSSSFQYLRLPTTGARLVSEWAHARIRSWSRWKFFHIRNGVACLRIEEL
jgi:hypothetical protein